MTHRVFYTEGDTTGRGRWQDIDTSDPADATWQVALTAGEGTRFLAVIPLADPAPTGD